MFIKNLRYGIYQIIILCSFYRIPSQCPKNETKREYEFLKNDVERTRNFSSTSWKFMKQAGAPVMGR
jgi:hypothetical protein